jgi:hypothetical protein
MRCYGRGERDARSEVTVRPRTPVFSTGCTGSTGWCAGRGIFAVGGGQRLYPQITQRHGCKVCSQTPNAAAALRIPSLDSCHGAATTATALDQAARLSSQLCDHPHNLWIDPLSVLSNRIPYQRRWHHTHRYRIEPYSTGRDHFCAASSSANCALAAWPEDMWRVRPLQAGKERTDPIGR